VRLTNIGIGPTKMQLCAQFEEIRYSDRSETQFSVA
jgi:hypothetical protein